MLTQRLGSDTQKNPEFTDSLLKAIKNNPGSCDEVWFATDYGFPEIETHQKTADTVIAQAEKFRREGIRVSLQLSNTIGHGRYMSSCDCSGLVYPGSPVGKMTGADGEIADYCFCWNDEYFRNYTVAALRPYLRMKPYRVWVDDDFRAPNHDPVRYGCFCEKCIDRFNGITGEEFTRSSLVNEINYGRKEIRQKFVDFQRRSLYDFMYMLTSEIHRLSSETAMGFQSYASGGYTGFGLSHILDAMSDASGLLPASRPGGGVYSDAEPGDFIRKGRCISWQNYLLPEYVKEIRPEIENLPDTVFSKTPAGTCLETSVYFAFGANAMSYAMLMNDYEPMEWHAGILKRFSQARPYWEKLSALSLSGVPAGLRAVTSRFEYMRSCDNEPPFSWCCEHYADYNKLERTAIPYTFFKTPGCVNILCPSIAKFMTDDEVYELLSQPCITDGESLRILTERGFGCSADARNVDTSVLYERFLPHPVNDGFVNGSWSQSFYIKSGYEIIGECEPFSAYETLSRSVYKRMNENYPLGIANAVITTSKNAKWAVFGHSPWNDTISLDKRNQLINAADYISEKRLPAVLLSPAAAVLLPVENASGDTVGVSIINCTVGFSGELQLCIRRPAGKQFSFMSAGMKNPVPVEFTEKDGEYILSVPEINPWSVGTVFIG